MSERLTTALADLLDWEATMGGFEAPVWQRARAAYEAEQRAATRAPRKPRGTLAPCPNDFQPDETSIAWAAQHAPGMGAQQIMAIARDFRAYWTARAINRKDWQGSFREWMRREIKAPAVRQHHQPRAGEGVRDALDALNERLAS